MVQGELRLQPGEAEGLPEVGAIVADKYRIVRLIGRGGTGAVFQASHLVTGKQLALKYLLPRSEPSPDDIGRFIREARTAGRVAHPNIVDIYDVGEQGGSFFLVMELLRGRPLRDWMRQGALEPGPLLRSLLPALRGVHAAHRSGVVHRDLKPENVFLCSDHDGELLTAKVLDFGISKVAESAGITLQSITHTGVVMGTPYYMSPEQAEDSSSVDRRTDIYACGVMLYEALSGTLPYRAESLTALLLRITRGDALPLRKLRPDLPAALEDAVMRAMARDPEQRFADMRALIAALEPFAGERLLPLTPDPAQSGGWLANATPAAAAAANDGRGTRVRWRGPLLLAGVALLIGALALRFAQGETAGGGPAAAARIDARPAPAVAVEVKEEKEMEEAARKRVAASPHVPAPALAPTAEPAGKGTGKGKGTENKSARRQPSLPEVPAAPAGAVPVPALAPGAPAPAPAAPAAPARGKLGIDMRADQF